MLPGIRLGLAVIPEIMRESFIIFKFAADLHTPVLSQGALEIYLKSGLFSAHIQNMRNLYHTKAICLQKAYKEYLPSIASYSGSLSGFYSTIELPDPLKAKQLIEHMKKEGVFMDDAEKMYLPEFAKDTMIRLSISQVEDELISIGVQKIAAGILELLKMSTHVNSFRWG